MKIAFIGHSYHRTTRSTVFFIDELRRRGDVELLWDESWLGKPELDLSRVLEEAYDAVVVFQVERLATVVSRAARNVTFIPMYDGCHGLRDSYWTGLGPDVKVLSFSSTLHERLQRLRVRSRYVQYFPDPATFQLARGGDELHGFFWQRKNDITWATVRPLVGDAPFRRFTLHKAIDPDAGAFVEPTQEEVRRFGVRTTEWFTDRAAAAADLASHNVYFAPRLREGIGQSFIEAMAMGFLVVAPDHPTMNEYIVSGVNGILYDPGHPVALDFSRRAELGARARRTVERGHEKWQRCVEPAIDYVFAPPGEVPVLAPWDTFDPWATEGATRTPYRRAAPAAAPRPAHDARLEGGLRVSGGAAPARPRVTVAIVTRNAEKTLGTTLESVLGLDFPDREVVVIDGASEDRTLDLLREYDGELAYWRSARDGGPFEAMNAAALEARGEYVIYMNAGDVFQARDSLTLAFDGTPADADVIFGHHVYRHVDGHDEIHRAASFDETWRKLRAGDVGWRWQSAVPGHQATLTRTELLRRFPYRTELRIAADHDALYRFATAGARFHHCGAALSTYVGGGLSWQNQQRCLEEWRRIALDHTERQAEVQRAFVPMAADVRRQVLSTLSTWALLRQSPGDPVARSLVHKRIRRSLKERFQRVSARAPQIAIDFGAPELGGVRYATGLSAPEPWGRWTEGAHAVIQLATPIPNPVRVSLQLRAAFGPNVGKRLVMRLDGSEYEHVLAEGEQVFSVKLARRMVGPLGRIELAIPSPASPAALSLGSDGRLLGVALRRLHIHAGR